MQQKQRDVHTEQKKSGKKHEGITKVRHQKLKFDTQVGCLFKKLTDEKNYSSSFFKKNDRHVIG